MTLLFFIFIYFFAFSLVSQSVWIDWLRYRQVKLVQKSYGPERSLAKGRTPALGGVIFLVMSLPGVLFCWSMGSESLSFYVTLWSLPFLSGLVGLWDDLLKWFRRSSEGLKSMEKLALQVMVALTWSLIAYRLGYLHLFPDISLSPLATIGTVTFIAVSMLNAVNVTDGLDGLATGATALSLIVLAFLVSRGVEAISVGLAISISFLWHNTYPARIFMGDGGSHFFGGLLVAVAVCGGGVFYVVPSGILFGLELLSVAIQIISIRIFSKKIFLMSPLHHHFEILGWSEAQIVVRFLLIHLLGIILALWVGPVFLSIF